MKRITKQLVTRVLVLVCSAGITYGLFRMISWAHSVNSNDLEFIQLVQFLFVCVAGFTVMQVVMVIRSYKYPKQ